MYVGPVNHFLDPKVDMGTSGAPWTPEPPILFARMALVGHFQPRALQGPPGHQNRQFCLPDWSFGAPGPAGAPELKILLARMAVLRQLQPRGLQGTPWGQNLQLC